MLIPRIIYIPLLAIYRAFNQLGVLFLLGGFYFHLPTETIAVRIFFGGLFVRRFYSTFINCFRIFHVIQTYSKICFCNIFTVKTLNIPLPTPSIWHTVQKDLIKIHLTNLITSLFPEKESK